MINRDKYIELYNKLQETAHLLSQHNSTENTLELACETLRHINSLSVMLHAEIKNNNNNP